MRRSLRASVARMQRVGLPQESRGTDDRAPMNTQVPHEPQEWVSQRPTCGRLRSPSADAVTSDNTGGGTNAMTGKKKVLFLMSDTGGGHRAPSKAAVNALERLYPQSRRRDRRHLDGARGLAMCRRLSALLRDHAPSGTWMWRMMWYAQTRSLPRSPAALQEIDADPMFSTIGKCSADAKPDLVVSVHPLCPGRSSGPSRERRSTAAFAARHRRHRRH